MSLNRVQVWYLNQSKLSLKTKLMDFFFKQKINICSTFLNQFKSTEGVLSIAIEVKKIKES